MKSVLISLIFRMETLLGSDLSVGPMTLVNQKDKLEESAEQKREGDKPGSLIVSNIPALLTNKVIIYSELYLLTVQGYINFIFLQLLFLLGSGEGWFFNKTSLWDYLICHRDIRSENTNRLSERFVNIAFKALIFL